MVGRSNVLVFVLALGALFAILYASSVFSEPGHAHSSISTEPQISQLRAIEIIDQDLRAKVPDLQETRLIHQLYNFSVQEYESNTEYVEYIMKNVGYGYTFEYVKSNPELLQLPLRFVHANGTVYEVNESAQSFEKICDEPSLVCPMGRFGLFAKDRLVYTAEIRWQPPTKEILYNEGYYIIDAEAGEIVWNSIDHEKNRKPTPSVNFDNKTIAQLFRERLSPPETAFVNIERGASNAENDAGYVPKEIRTTLGIDNKIVWMNNDAVAHTVMSDDGYSNNYAGRFESGRIEPNGTFEYTFFGVGLYPYHCDIHPWMKGTIEVLENFS